MAKENKELKNQKQLVLIHLNSLSNKNLHIPVISLSKSYSWNRLYAEVKSLSGVGKAFIKEMVKNVEEMKARQN